MDVLVSTGSAGLGLVWGWLAGRLGMPMAHPVSTGLALIVSSVVFAILVHGLAGVVPTVTFTVAAGIAAALHYSWRRQLSAQCGGRATEGRFNHG